MKRKILSLLVCVFTSCILIVSVFPIQVFAAKTTSEIVAENKAKLAEQEEIIKMYAEFYARQEEEQEKKQAKSEETKSENEVNLQIHTREGLLSVGEFLWESSIFPIVVMFCMLWTFAIVGNLFLELFKSAWYAYKKKEYRREAFASKESCKQILLYIVVLLVGIWGFFYIAIDSTREKYKPEYIGTCNDCGSLIVEGAEITAFDTYHDYVCPHCANTRIKKIINGEDGVCAVCGNVYDTKFSGQYGMCEDCEWENLVPCSGCDEPTIDWNSEIEMVFCPRCMGDIITDKGVQRAIERYLNS